MRAACAALADLLALLLLLVGLWLLPVGFFLPAFALPALALPALGLRADKWPECRTDSLCAATGGTTIRTDSTAATQRAAVPEIETGEESALISSLYSR